MAEIKTEELEKEAEEIYMKTDKEFMYCQDEGEIFNLGYLAGSEPREKQIADLEKENAELKRDKEDLIFIRNQNAKCMCEDKENLTKAKELLKRIIKVTWGEGWNYSLGVKVEAENFLKEIEE